MTKIIKELMTDAIAVAILILASAFTTPGHAELGSISQSTIGCPDVHSLQEIYNEAFPRDGNNAANNSLKGANSDKIGQIMAVHGCAFFPKGANVQIQTRGQRISTISQSHLFSKDTLLYVRTVDLVYFNDVDIAQ